MCLKHMSDALAKSYNQIHNTKPTIQNKGINIQRVSVSPKYIPNKSIGDHLIRIADEQQ